MIFNLTYAPAHDIVRLRSREKEFMQIITDRLFRQGEDAARAAGRLPVAAGPPYWWSEELRFYKLVTL